VPPPTRIAQVQNTEFATIMPIDSKEAVKISNQIIEMAIKNCNDLAKFNGGLYVETSNKPAVKGDKSELQRQHALDYARYAASNARTMGKQLEVFSPVTAEQILGDLRKKKRYRQAIEDCKTLRAVGIHNAAVENNSALCGYYIGKSEQEFLFDAGRAAMQLDPSNTVYTGNMGIYTFLFSSHLNSYPFFRDAYINKPEKRAPPQFVGPIALSVYAELEAGGEIDVETVISLLETAKQQDEFSFGVHPEQITAALSAAISKRSSSANGSDSFAITNAEPRKE
jgi:hypothetical protein